MGIFNLLKLANDYTKAKKLLEKNNISIDTIRTAIEKVKEVIAYIKSIVIAAENVLEGLKEKEGELTNGNER